MLSLYLLPHHLLLGRSASSPTGEDLSELFGKVDYKYPGKETPPAVADRVPLSPEDPMQHDEPVFQRGSHHLERM